MKTELNYLAIGNEQFNREEYQNALASYEKAIVSKPDYAKAWYNKGLVLKYLKRYEEALSAYDKAIELNPDYSIAWNNKGFILISLNKYEEAAICFEKANKDILDIIVYTNRLSGGKIATLMLEKDSFFKETISQQKNSLSEKQNELYKRIYIRSLQIIKRLHITSKQEKEVAHYTKKIVSHQLIVDKSKFRLNSITNSNDPKEGETLLDYLLPEKNTFEEDNRAFVGCFVFDPDYLNQFRLYGKDNGKEATGVSIIANNNFFSKDIKRSTSSVLTLKDKIKEKNIINKLPLFRCIYIDPDTGFIASLGHKEEHIFYREDSNSASLLKEIEDYKAEIQKILESVRKQLESLKRYIQRNKKALDLTVVARLLINLRFLTKHVAFKEEQECRIVRILPVSEQGDEIRTVPGQMYVDYIPMTDYVEKIYFAPKTTGMNLYKDILRQVGLERIKCVQCNHPFVG